MAENNNNAAERKDADAADEAAAWFLKLNTGAITNRDAGYQTWLAGDPRHEALMANARIAWGMVGDHASAPEMISARSEALADGARAARARWRPWTSWGAGAKAVAAAVALMLVAAPVTALYISGGVSGGAKQAQAVATETYKTAIGETRIVTLADNSRVSLDASTELTVLYTNEARKLELLKGQAHFDVAKDMMRPFHVKAGDQTVTATGTAFNIELIDTEVFVTLIEGEVIVTDDRMEDNQASALARTTPPSSQNAPSPPQLTARTLKPGEQLIASLNTKTTVHSDANIQKTTAWRSGKVILENDALSAAIARVNRYSRIRITLADEGLDALTVSGVFDAGDTDGFLEALEAYFPVKARRISATQIELHPQS